MFKENIVPKEQVSNSEKIKNLLRDISESYRREGIPVDNDCQIDITKLSQYYSQEIIKKDIDKIERIKERIKEEEKERGVAEKEKKGKRLERLKTVIFNKFLGKDSIVVRSSEYDDIINGVDNILIDKKTGKTICAFDEVCDINREIFKKKREKILEKKRARRSEIKILPQN